MTNHQSKPNNQTMQSLLIIFTLLVGSVLCMPNQQQHRGASADYDKQLLRKTLEESGGSSSSSGSISSSSNNIGGSSAVRSSTDSTNATSAVNFQCPEQFGYYTDTRDCTKYYVCVFGEVLHESCTGGLRFSRELQTCDWPRNVECAQQAVNGSVSSVSRSSTFATTVPTVTTSNGLFKQQQLNANAKELPADDDQQDQTPKGSSMVFADEGSDPQQPSFDEAVSPVITADGAIHLHDGSGGTFSLTPNHRANTQTQQQPQEGQNVDVFVKPLVAQSVSVNNRPRNLQSNNRPVQVTPKLQAATLPDQRSGHQHITGQQNSNQHHNQRSSRQNLPQTTASFHNFNSDNNNDDKINSNDQTDEGGEVANAGGVSDNIADLNDENPPDDSVSADQESNENQDSETLANDEELSGQQLSPSSGYIPPVMAPNTLRQSSSSPPSVGASSSRQLSQLLSINNRQVDSSRSLFKPIIFNSPSQVSKKQQLQASNNKQRNQFESNQHEDARLSNNNNSNNLRQNSMRQNQTLHYNTQQQNNQQQHIQIMVAQQNNRQSRMSNQQQFSPSIGDSHQSRLIPLSSDQTMSNNVNFNDSSKLIRLQASQFETPLSTSVVDSNGNSFPKFPAPSSRSQNILFSQPFGFNADTNGNAGSDGGSSVDGRNSHNNVPDHQGDPGTLQFDENGGRSSNNDNSNNDETHFQHSNSQLLQQQRRPRPPKRQQIPVGSAATAIATRRPSVNLNQLRPTQTSQPIEFDTPTTTRMTTTTNQPAANGFLLTTNDGATFIESEETTAPPTTTTTRQTFQTAGQAPSRPIVVPTTINFQQQEGLTTSFGPIQPPITTFATTPSTTITLSTASGDNGARRFSNPINVVDSTSSNGIDGLATSAANRGFQNQGHRSSQLLASSAAPTLPSTSERQQLPSPTAVTNSNSNANNPTASNHEQEQQLAANRYLNSAIDALEAGQPFGTVDYDFDILNDNSTERRNPTAANSASSGSFHSQSNNSSLSLSYSNLNANRQRQPAFTGQDDGENISLTNGHPNGGQIGLSLRPQQQQGSIQMANSRARVAGSGQQQASRQRDSAAASASSQFNQDSFNTSQQQQASLAASSNQQQQQQQQNLPTKKPRPTNKKISVNHEQAIANNRASTEPAKRPEALFATPTALQTATKCDNRVCRLPDCKCGDTLTPGGLEPKVIPQVILLTFDDAVNDLNWEIYEELFTGRTNPNGCPILATFYVSHEWTDYGQVQTLYSRGHEMASHSVTHSFGEKFSKSQWFKEVNGQREILNMYGGVKMNDVRGMRAPFLQIGGNKMFEMLYDANFTYDSSMPIFENSPPLWPYTLDYQLSHECMITPCPTKSFPGVWEVGMTMWVDLRGGRCSMGDACSNPPDEDGVYEMLMKNFNRHYKSNRAPFGLFYHSAWFNTIHHRRGFLRFIGTVNSLSDVFFVTNWQMLQWMRRPTPLDEINSFEPWQCPTKNDRPPPCFHPSVCNVKSEHGTRFMKTCQPCPANQQYPWVGSTGFKGKQSGGSG